MQPPVPDFRARQNMPNCRQANFFLSSDAHAGIQVPNLQHEHLQEVTVV